MKYELYSTIEKQNFIMHKQTLPYQEQKNRFLLVRPRHRQIHDRKLISIGSE